MKAATLSGDLGMFIPPPTIVDGKHYALGSSVRPSGVRPMSVRCPSQSQQLFRVTRDICVFSEGISMKLGTNIHHMSGHCWRGFQGQRLKIKVIAIPSELSRKWIAINFRPFVRRTHYDRQCGSAAELFRKGMRQVRAPRQGLAEMQWFKCHKRQGNVVFPPPNLCPTSKFHKVESKAHDPRQGRRPECTVTSPLNAHAHLKHC